MREQRRLGKTVPSQGRKAPLEPTPPENVPLLQPQESPMKGILAWAIGIPIPIIIILYLTDVF